MMDFNRWSDILNAANGCCCSSSTNRNDSIWISANPVPCNSLDYSKIHDIMIKSQGMRSNVAVCDEVHAYSNDTCCCEKEEEKSMHTRNYENVYKENKNKVSLSEDFVRKVKFKPARYDNTDIPFVDRVETYNDRVVKVTFIDGTFTKSVCSENDAFDLDVGITICLMKRWLGKDGNRLYNNLIRKIHKRMDQKERIAQKEKELRAEIREKERKMKAKKAAKKEKARQEQIEIQKQSYIEALKTVSGVNGQEDDLK